MLWFNWFAKPEEPEAPQTALMVVEPTAPIKRQLIRGSRLEALRAALSTNEFGGTLLMDNRDTTFAGWTASDLDEDAHVVNAVKSVPTHYAGLSSLAVTVSSGFNWQAGLNMTGSAYNPVSNPGNITKSYSIGTAAANGAVGGADEVFSFQQGITAGSSATLDLTAMTNLVLQASVAIVRVKSFQIRLLSATDDPTITPAPTSTSVGVVTNIGPATPAVMDFSNGGSGLTLTLTVGATIVTAVAIGAAGAGYPPSTCFLVSPTQTGGSGCVVAVVTNGSGVPTSVVFITGAGGTGYTAATVPSVVVGQFPLTTGNAHMSIDVTAAGFAVDATHKNLKFYNLDAAKAITFEVDVVAGTT